MKTRLLLILTACVLGCSQDAAVPAPKQASREASKQSGSALLEARRGFPTQITVVGEPLGPPDRPPGEDLTLVDYRSPAGQLAAYLTPDPKDGKRHPAILWITGGDNNSIGDVWSPADRSNDQSAKAFRDAGIVTMYPSQRGGNDNPGKRESFLGEVDDILAAADHVAKLPYVDPERIYLGGHSTGGTLAMLVGECSDRFRAVFALGPVASPVQYGGSFAYYDTTNEQENNLRSPYLWLDSVKSPMFVFEGVGGNWEGAVQLMAEQNTNPLVRFFPIPEHDHFTVIAPLNELIAKQIVADRLTFTPEMLSHLE